jgi:hypothetical protein
MKKCIALLAVFLILWSCSTVPITNRKRVNMVSDAQILPAAFAQYEGFLKEHKFSIGPFLTIGVISAIRRLLYIEAQASYEKHLPLESLYELSVTALVILVLIIAYYFASKAREIEAKTQ